MKQELLPILPPPEREAFEREIAEVVGVNGTLTTIARLLQKDLSAVSRAFNPYEMDRKNPFFEAMFHLWALDHINPELGDQIVKMCLRERDKWTPKRGTADDHAKLSCEVGKQFMEAMETEMSGKSHDEQIREWLDVETAAKAKKDAVIAQRNVRYMNGVQR